VRRTALLLAALLAASGCTRLFYYPDNRLYQHPDKYGLQYETPKFESADGTTLFGLFMPAQGTPVRGTVVHFHGNGGNLTGHFLYSSWLVKEGFNVFIFDYRGYGNSHGHPSPDGVVQDGVAAIRYVRGRTDVDPARVVVLGQSLGGAIAAVAAVEAGAVRAVALESPVASYRSVARAKLKASLVTRVLLRPFTSVLVSGEADAAKAIPRLCPTPLLILHGDADLVVPYSEGRTLFDAAREPKELVTVPGGRHTEAFTKFGDTYRPKLVQFYLQALDGAPPPLPLN
jgi:fermentation-respiration switch protein FrsA (DUF1100 family)